MALKINILRCRVRVRGGRSEESPLYQEEGPERPELLFALPNAPVSLETGTEYGRTAEAARERGHNVMAPEAGGVNTRRVDPRAVAERVYDLFREETRKRRERGG